MTLQEFFDTDYCNELGADSIDEVADQEIRATKAVYKND